MTQDECAPFSGAQISTWPPCVALPPGQRCEADGECGTNDQLNNCEMNFDGYVTVECAPPPAATYDPGPKPCDAHCFAPVAAGACPATLHGLNALPDCWDVEVGAACEYDNGCAGVAVSNDLDNCGPYEGDDDSAWLYDVYTRVQCPPPPRPRRSGPSPGTRAGSTPLRSRSRCRPRRRWWTSSGSRLAT